MGLFVTDEDLFWRVPAYSTAPLFNGFASLSKNRMRTSGLTSIGVIARTFNFVQQSRIEIQCIVTR